MARGSATYRLSNIQNVLENYQPSILRSFRVSRLGSLALHIATLHLTEDGNT